MLRLMINSFKYTIAAAVLMMSVSFLFGGDDFKNSWGNEINQSISEVHSVSNELHHPDNKINQEDVKELAPVILDKNTDIETVMESEELQNIAKKVITGMFTAAIF